ncbi:hypothetical protein DEA06_00785 [Microbacterium sp. Gd 4-13]|uniref:DUF4129 domain-containing protein n=1 Tax=Microbacterium sp. Gd 4-13 TaxID=2173179 RepID=UPI000D56E038|nr:DUF4129 domain-containing protein [Microbacterium sp. Gd 4-13]PVW06123.1 hypothetical protein DEA06_00785 [Microbacterium sp. Gd 4-13]
MTAPAILTHVLAAAPLSPDRDAAREWAERELSDPRYAAAEPNLLDRAARAVVEFVGGLFNGQLTGDWGPVAAIVVAVIVAVLIVAGLLVWGRPRRSARLPALTTPLFGDADARTAADLRRDAAAAASAGEWNDAIVLRFRALARGLAERTLVEVSAGTTVHGFARRAALVFPAESQRMEAAAAAFDDVRYLRRPGSETAYRAISALDDDLARARPALAGVS